MRRRRVVYDIVWNEERGEWLVLVIRRVVTSDPKKAIVTAWAKKEAKAQALSQVRVHGKDGRIQTEYTYPRSSDPERFVG